MRAWQINKYGGPHELECKTNVAVPTIRSPFDVLIEVWASSVNPLDVGMTDGYGSSFFGALRTFDQMTLFPSEFPLTIGRDFSGIVRETGQAVKNFKQGDEVVGIVGLHKQGTHSEYTIGSSCLLSKKPSNLSHVEAASIAYAGLTAWSALRIIGGIQPYAARGKRALVLGGSGGVGTLAIQLLKSWGIQVTTVVNADAIPLVTSLGADYAIDYSQPQWERSLKELKGFDIVLNCTATLPATFGIDLMKVWSNAKYIHLLSPLLRNINAYGLPIGLLNSALELGYDNARSLSNGQTYRWAYVLPSKSGLDKLMDMASIGQLQPVIEKVFPFEQTVQAFEKVKAGHARGKTVINMKAEVEAASPADGDELSDRLLD